MASAFLTAAGPVGCVLRAAVGPGIAWQCFAGGRAVARPAGLAVRGAAARHDARPPVAVHRPRGRP